MEKVESRQLQEEEGVQEKQVSQVLGSGSALDQPPVRRNPSFATAFLCIPRLYLYSVYIATLQTPAPFDISRALSSFRYVSGGAALRTCTAWFSPFYQLRLPDQCHRRLSVKLHLAGPTRLLLEERCGVGAPRRSAPSRCSSVQPTQNTSPGQPPWNRNANPCIGLRTVQVPDPFGPAASTSRPVVAARFP